MGLLASLRDTTKIDRIDSALTRLDATRPSDGLSRAIGELCKFLKISHTTFMSFNYTERFDTLGCSVFTARNPDIRALMARKILADISSLKDERAEEARAAVESAKESLWAIFKYLTHGLSDPATVDGECRSTLIISLNPVQCGPYTFRAELGDPEFNQMSAAEREQVLSQYPPAMLKAHAEIILWTLEALMQEKKFPSAQFNISVVEDFLNNLNTKPIGGITNVIGPGSSSSAPQQ